MTPIRFFRFGALALLIGAMAPPKSADAADSSSSAPQSSSTNSAMPKDRAALDQAIHDYLMAHPDVVVDALKAAQQQADAQAAEQSRYTISAKKKEIFESPDDLVQGNPKGNVTLVEFFDYRCPYCKQIEPSLDALLKEDGKLRIVYKEFPILGEASVYATHVALAAKKQGKYAEFHRAMMATKGDISDDTVLNVATSIGLDVSKIKSDMGAPEVGKVIDTNYALADALNIQGTPALILGDTLIPGAVDLDTLRKDIAAARRGG
ncbi:MAG TPA: DsbA family protein [Stellaceae bacterium]|nr:DsbA family protein [Stellaceae bacterium]